MTPQQARLEMDRINRLPPTPEHDIEKYVRYWDLGAIWIAGLKKELERAA